MNYKELQYDLISKFSLNDFKTKWQSNEINNSVLNIENDYDVDLKIYFPGYKTEEKNGSLVYDYRVELRDIPISHTNIITDIHSKANQLMERNPALLKRLYTFLVDLSRNGLDLDLEKYNELIKFDFQPPDMSLIEKVKKAHFGKMYNENANSWSYTFEELFIAIPYIVLQEDINYPMPQYEGRRLSFYRYIESILSSYEVCKIEYVIHRALAHKRLELFEQHMKFYEPVKNIVNL